MTAFSFCGSFCTLSRSMGIMEELCRLGEEVIPVMSERAATTDTRFGKAEDFKKRAEEISKNRLVLRVEEAELFGPVTPLDYMIIAPCTGNTLAKIANGITDSTVTMAAKAHLRCDRPLLIALASNDAMSQNLANIAKLLQRKSVYFVPMRQDSPKGKPHSLVFCADLVIEAYQKMKLGEQMRPLFLV